MQTIRVELGPASHDAHVGAGIIDRVGEMARHAGLKSGSCALVTDATVEKLYAARVTDALRKSGFAPVVISVPPGEASKSLATLELLYDRMTEAALDRGSVIFALGGGVVGDLAGFAAATYLRGVALVQVPTTVVAQVDSAVGGKTGVNLPEGKNLVGAFYPPSLVIADPAFLHTLPHREFRSGLYEVVKYGVIADPKLFAFLEKHMDTVLRRDSKALDYIISRSIAIKAVVVGKDEREAGLRQILNFGHTLGHALEAATGYRVFLHGEAIAWGMIAAAMMALSLDRLPLVDAFRIVRLVASVGPLPKIPAIPAAKLRSILAGDKKSRGGRVLWVFPRKIGKTEWGIEVPSRLVEATVRSLPEIVNEARNGAGFAGSRRRKS